MKSPGIYKVSAPTVTLYEAASCNARASSECLFGERLEALDKIEDWLKVKCLQDGYEGYVRDIALQSSPDQKTATHWVQTRSTLLFSDASIKSPVVYRLPFQSRLSIDDNECGAFSRTVSGHYVWRNHILEVDKQSPLDPLQLAHSHFLGAPYLWGGRSTAGLDCSGLVQALASAKGLSIPRDSHEQEVSITQQIDPALAQPMDLVFWPGHVGLLQTPTNLLHATAHCLSCVVEPLSDVVKRAGKISSVRRLFS